MIFHRRSLVEFSSLRGERPGPVQRLAAQQICVAVLGDDRKDPQAFRDVFDNLGAHR